MQDLFSTALTKPRKRKAFSYQHVRYPFAYRTNVGDHFLSNFVFAFYCVCRRGKCDRNARAIQTCVARRHETDVDLLQLRTERSKTSQLFQTGKLRERLEDASLTKAWNESSKSVLVRFDPTFCSKFFATRNKT